MARTKVATPVMAWVLRIFVLLNLISTVGFIIYAIILENPPTSALPLGLLVIGVVGATTGLLGLMASCCYRSCLMTLYVVLAVLVTLAELGITLSLFFGTSQVVDNLAEAEYGPTPTQDQIDSIHTKVVQGRWFFLVVVVLQFIGMVAGLILRLCVFPRAADYEEGGFEAGGGAHQATLSQIQMENLKHSTLGRGGGGGGIGGGGDEPAAYYAGSKKISRSVTKKMAQKYGDYSHSSDFKKGWFARTFGV